MQFGPLNSKEAINKRFNQLRIESRQQILTKIYGSTGVNYNSSTIEKEISEAFCAILNNYDFNSLSHPAKEISQMFNINLDSFGKMDPKERQKILYDKIYAKVQESLRVMEKKNEEDSLKNPERKEKPNNHFEWLGVDTQYTELRPIFQQILLEKVKLFDNELTTITDHYSQLPLNTVRKTVSTFDILSSARQKTDFSKIHSNRNKTIESSEKTKRTQSCIEQQFCNVKIRDKSEFLLSKWTEKQQQQFLSKKAVFKSNLKINNIPVLFQFVKKYTSTVKARDHIYRKWEEREKYGITPDEVKYLCATSLFLNNSLAKSEKMRIRGNVRAAGPELISKLQLNISQKIIETYHQLMKKVADLRGKYYEERTQARKQQQQIGSRGEKTKAKVNKNRQVFLRYKQIFTRIVNGEKMRIILNPKIYKWVTFFIANLKKRIHKSAQKSRKDTVFNRLGTTITTNSVLLRAKMKFPSSKIIKREDNYSHRLKYHKYIPSEQFKYDPALQKTIKQTNKLKLNSTHSVKFYQQISGGPRSTMDSIRVDLTRKKISMSSPKCLRYIIIIQARWRATYERKRYKARLELVNQQRSRQFQEQVASLRRLYPVGRKVNMKVIQNRLKRISNHFCNILKPYIRINRRPINNYTSFCTTKLGLPELKAKYSRNGQIRLGEFVKLVQSDQLSMLKKSGMVITSKQINEIMMARGANPMWWAVYNSCAELVRIFLEGGGDPDSKDQDENTCLHVAIKKGDVEIIFLLLDYGADLNLKNSKKVTPLFFAAAKMLKLLGMEEGYVQGERDNNSVYFRGSHWSDDVYQQHYY